MFFCNSKSSNNRNDRDSLSFTSEEDDSLFGNLFRSTSHARTSQQQQQQQQQQRPINNPFTSFIEQQTTAWTFQLAKSDRTVLAMIAESQAPSTKDIDMLVQHELNELSSEEQDKLFLDVHGSFELNTEENIEHLLTELETELNHIQHKPSYDLAMNQDASYVCDSEFRKMFLRADDYHPAHAATRLVKFFQEKQCLFGEDKLTKEITRDDLNEEDMKCIKSGYTQLMDDGAQRSVFVLCAQHRCSDDIMSLARCIWLQWMSVALKGVEAQQRGLVAVLFNVGPNVSANRRLLWKSATMKDAFPLRVACFHYCFDQPYVHPLISIVRLFAGKELRTRIRIHEGSFMECKYSLLGYGIDSKYFPITDDGRLLVEPHPAWFDGYLRATRVTIDDFTRAENVSSMVIDSSLDPDEVILESFITPLDAKTSHSTQPSTISLTLRGQGDYNGASTIICNDSVKNGNETNNDAFDDSHEIIVEPGLFDVPFGRGAGTRLHPGYKKFQLLLDIHFDQYEAASKFKKTEIAEQILSLVRQSGGSFLKQVEGETNGWVEVDDTVARAKISHAFRSKRKSQSKKER